MNKAKRKLGRLIRKRKRIGFSSLLWAGIIDEAGFAKRHNYIVEPDPIYLRLIPEAVFK